MGATDAFLHHRAPLPKRPFYLHLLQNLASHGKRRKYIDFVFPSSFLAKLSCSSLNFLEHELVAVGTHAGTRHLASTPTPSGLELLPWRALPVTDWPLGYNDRGTKGQSLYIKVGQLCCAVSVPELSSR